jgi:hypothetical protein
MIVIESFGGAAARARAPPSPPARAGPAVS